VLSAILGVHVDWNPVHVLGAVASVVLGSAACGITAASALLRRLVR
jgi:hypothetical protein